MLILCSLIPALKTAGDHWIPVWAQLALPVIYCVSVLWDEKGVQDQKSVN